MDTNYIILFDGVCNFCNGAVNFIIDRDPAKKFVFAPLQESPGQAILNKYGLSNKDFDSVILVKEDKIYTKSSAALEIAKQLKGAWSLFYIFKLVPRFIRDAVYNLIAKNRYKWFGKEEACRIPTPDLKARFL